MDDDPADLTLIFLRRLDAKLDRLAEDMTDVKQRLTSIELGLPQGAVRWRCSPRTTLTSAPASTAWIAGWNASNGGWIVRLHDVDGSMGPARDGSGGRI